VYVDTDIVANGGGVKALGTDLGPLVIGVGFGYRF
jgi:outer membrane protein W